MNYDKRHDRNDEVYSKVIKAGKRTYFFDIKSTRGNDLYLTLTESKKSTEDGKEFFQKHKIFLYKEDFEKFREGLEEVMQKVEELRSPAEPAAETYESGSSFSSVDFESL